MKKLSAHTKGHSLVELLTAITILSLITSPFVSSLANVTTAQIKYRHRTQATQYAQEALEIAYNLAVNTINWQTFRQYGDNPDQNYFPFVDANGFFDLAPGEETNIKGKFNRSLSFSHKDNGLIVQVEITWQERNQPQEVAISTYLIEFET